MKLVESLFLERPENFYSVFSRKNLTVVIKIFCIVCFDAVARGLDDVSNNRLKCADV